VPLTDEQLRFIRGKRKSSPPSYYSIDTGGNIPTTGAVEDSLIIAAPEAKEKALSYIKLILDANSGSSEYSDLLDEYTERLTANAEAKKEAFDTLLKKFSEFKDGLTRGSDQDLLKEGMNPLLKAINRGIGKVVSLQRAADFAYDYEEASSEFFQERVTDQEKKELRSWIRVLAVYR
jgi:hypothetical protein